MFGIRIRIAAKNTSKFAAIAFQSGTFRMIFSQTLGFRSVSKVSRCEKWMRKTFEQKDIEDEIPGTPKPPI